MKRNKLVYYSNNNNIIYNRKYNNKKQTNNKQISMTITITIASQYIVTKVVPENGLHKHCITDCTVANNYKLKYIFIAAL